MMFSYIVYGDGGDILERGEQDGPVDVEALVAKHDLLYWKRVRRVEKFDTTIYNCARGGRITVKRIKKKEE